MSVENKKPNWKLVQEIAYFAIEDGSRVRKTKLIDITVGWNEISKDGMDYISWANSFMSLNPDMDGKIKLITFPIVQKS